MWSSLRSFQKGCHSKYVELQAHPLCVEQFELAGRDRLYFWVPGSWVAGPLAHLSLSPAAPPLTFTYPSDAAALKPTLPGSPGWTEAVRLLSEPIPDSATQPLLDPCDSHSAFLFFFYPRGQSSHTVSEFKSSVSPELECWGIVLANLYISPPTTAASSPGFPRYSQTLDY